MPKIKRRALQLASGKLIDSVWRNFSKRLMAKEIRMSHAPSKTIKSGSDATVLKEGSIVRKKYQPWAFDMHGRIFRQMMFLKTFGPLGLSPELISFDYDEISTSYCEGLPLPAFLNAHPERAGDTLDAICWAAFRVHEHGYNHCDLSPNNILCAVAEDGKISVKFIDAEYCRRIPHLLPCSESFDFRGAAHWMRSHFGHPYSGRLLDKDGPDAFFNRLSKLLKAELYRVTGSQANKPDARYIYHSFNLPGLKISLPEAQRDVPARFDKMGIDFAGKFVVDVGANIGGMSLEAAQRGAKVLGLELDAARVEAANSLAKFAGLNATFRVFDITADKMPSGDVTFFCAVDGYLPDKDAAYKKVADATKQTLIFETNRRDRQLTIQEWSKLWKDLGFKSVVSLDKSTDDVRAENHWREIYRCDK